jgi:hypothetical protein
MTVRKGPGLLGTMARTAQATGSSVASGSAVGSAAPEPPTAADLTARLQELTELNRAGAITDQEFTAAKARLLGI